MNRLFKLLLPFCLGFTCVSVLGQELDGTLTLNPDWQQKIYLLEVKGFFQFFSGSNTLIIDSASADNIGKFHFTHLKPNTIYRISTIKATNPALIINNGNSDNYSFFSFTTKGEKLTFTGDVAHLFRNAQYTKSSVRMKAFMDIIGIKMPAYDTLTTFNEARKSDPAYMQLFMQNLMATAETTNLALDQYLTTVSDPIVIAFAFAFIAYDGVLENHLPILTKHLYKLKGSTAPICVSLYTLLKKHENVAPPFLSLKKQTLYTIQGNPIRIDTIASRFILLDFWSSWCTPCSSAIRTALRDLHSKYSSADLTIIGLNEDKNLANAKKAIVQDHNSFIQIWRYAPQNKEKLSGIKTATLPGYLLWDTHTNKTYTRNNTSTIVEDLTKLLTE
ncbi:MAG: TlpA family protein disulfide reductase [Bacteroidetes bacterium]|nr:TlpA family protein disulfide reductase [Bacteroidota bacterium]